MNSKMYPLALTVMGVSVRTVVRTRLTLMRGFEFVNVCDCCKIIGLRSLFGTNIVHRHEDNIPTRKFNEDDKNVEDYQQETTEKPNTESEDFFGIPDNFRLQQTRFSSSHSLPQSPCGSPPNTALGFNETNTPGNHDNADYLVQPSERMSRRQKRRDRQNLKERLTENTSKAQQSHLNKNHFVTSFGCITFDKNMSSDSLQKFSEKLSVVDMPVQSPEPSSISQNSHLPIRTQANTSKEFAERHKFSHEKRPVPNYFDEVFFPGQIEKEENKLTFNHDSFASVSNPNVTLQNRPINHGVSSESVRKDLNSDTDRQNLRSNHGLEDNAEFLNGSEHMKDHSLFDEQYFTAAVDKERNEVDDYENKGKYASGSHGIEDQYFGSVAPPNSSSKLNDAVSVLREEKMAFVDQQYFGTDKRTDGHTGGFGEIDQIVSQYQNIEQPVTAERDTIEPETDVPSSISEPESVVSNVEFLQKKRQTKASSFPKANLESPTSAYDVAMKIRRDLKTGHEEKYSNMDFEKEPWNVKKEPWFGDESEETVDIESKYPLDSKGYRILQEQVVNWDDMTTRDAVINLRNRIIFNHEDFLALDKPYGLSCFGQGSSKLNVRDLLPKLTESWQRQFKVSELHLVQGLDRDVSGPVILAKSLEIASILQGLYNTQGEIIQRFWAITKGVPRPATGIVDIPIGVGKVGNIHKTVLRPLYSNLAKPLSKRTSSAPSFRAITEYKVLCRHKQAAVVECTPVTNNLKHQLRVHLASGLNTPVLGDHKYSHFSKLAPQKLHGEMLELLKIRQSKVRHLALHLHCRSVVLTNYKGRMYFLTTRPPLHFKENAMRLKLFIPRQFMKRI